MPCLSKAQFCALLCVVSVRKKSYPRSLFLTKKLHIEIELSLSYDFFLFRLHGKLQYGNDAFMEI